MNSLSIQYVQYYFALNIEFIGEKAGILWLIHVTHVFHKSRHMHLEVVIIENVWITHSENCVNLEEKMKP